MKKEREVVNPQEREERMDRIYRQMIGLISSLNSLGYFVSDSASTICIFDSRQKDRDGDPEIVRSFMQ